MQKLEGGMTNSVYLDPNKNTIIKKYDKKSIFSGNGLTIENRMKRETIALNRFANLNIPVPNIINVDDKQSTIELEYIEGQSLNEFLINDHDINLEKTVFLALGTVLRRIHTPINSSIAEYKKLQLRKLLTYLKQSEKVLLIEEINKEILYLKLLSYFNSKEISELGLTRIHGDYWQGNIIIDSKRQAHINAIIDWELSGIGTPLEDFATILFRLGSFKSYNEMWEGYEYFPNEKTVKAALVFKIIRLVSFLNIETYQTKSINLIFKPLISIIKEFTAFS